MTIVISLDLGTTGNRAIAWNQKGEIVAQSYSEFTQHYPQPSWVEHDAEEIWQTCIKTLKDVLSHVQGMSIASIGITNQRETVVLWDTITQKPLYNAIVWQCRRTKDYCTSLKAQEESVKAKTGLSLDPYFSATKIKWLLDKTTPNLNTTKVGTIDSWILYKLTNGNSHKTDTTNASRTLLMNLETLTYDTELCNLFKIPKEILPEICPSVADFGYTDSLICGQKIPIKALIGDQQAAFFAQAGAKPGTIKNTYGTGCFLMAGIGDKIRLDSNLITTVAISLKNTTYYAFEGSIFSAGSSINWLKDTMKLIDDPSQTNAIDSKCPSTQGVYVVPAFSGLGTPHWAPNARASITGITFKTTPSHIIRATLESIAFQSYDVISLFKSSLNTNFNELWVDGGVSKNPFLLQFQADILQMPILKATHNEMTAFGAAGAAGIGSQLWDISAFLALKKKAVDYKPKLKQSQITPLIKGWHNALSNCLKLT